VRSTFSLLRDAWIPVRCRSGLRHLMRPADLTADYSVDPVVAVEWPRPDFRLASLEFLIGLLGTAIPPEDGTDWLERYHSPPSPDALAEALAPIAHAFDLDGPGPRFMQELGDFQAAENRIDTLLIDAPGDQTLKRNTDLLVKRSPNMVLSRAAAAMALYTLQTYAPAGGAGNRTSLRGGGPMTTLALPGGTPSLWQMVWANVPLGETPQDDEWPHVFPWLAATRVSDRDQPTTPAQSHPLQAFWGMPRRIRLDVVDNQSEVACGLTGRTDEFVVKSWRQRPWGVKYVTWLHPLSPYYRTKPAEPYLPIHPQPGGIGYRDWQGLLLNDSSGNTRTAQSVETFKTRARLLANPPDAWRLLAAGFDMDNMKARGFAESEMPILLPANPAEVPAYEETLRQMIAGASETASLLSRAVRHALFGEGAKIAFDAVLLAAVRERFWDATGDAFFGLTNRCAESPVAEAVRREWLKVLTETARRLFDEAAPIEASGDGHPGRVAAASRNLGLAMAGYGKAGRALFDALGLPPHEQPKGKGPKPRKVPSEVKGVSP
jgi:CRISPR system Cascade subunit CasA